MLCDFLLLFLYVQIQQKQYYLKRVNKEFIYSSLSCHSLLLPPNSLCSLIEFMFLCIVIFTKPNNKTKKSFLDKKAVLRDKHYFLHRFHKHLHNKQKKIYCFYECYFFHSQDDLQKHNIKVNLNLQKVGFEILEKKLFQSYVSFFLLEIGHLLVSAQNCYTVLYVHLYVQIVHIFYLLTYFICLRFNLKVHKHEIVLNFFLT